LSDVLADPPPESGPGGAPARGEAALRAPRSGRWTRDDQIDSLIAHSGEIDHPFRRETDR